MKASYWSLPEDRAALTLSKYTSSGKTSYFTSMPVSCLNASRFAIIASA